MSQSQISQLLKYQEVDERLLSVENDFNNSPERKQYVQAKNFLNKASERLDQLEAIAVELEDTLEKIKADYAETEETLKDYDNISELVEEGADTGFYKKSLTHTEDTLHGLRSRVNKLSSEAKKAGEDYRDLKKRTIATQKQFNGELTAAYKKKLEETRAAKAGIEKELEELGKDIDPDLLSRYVSKRNERIFPIICELNGKRCPKCGMELSILGEEKVKSDKIVECDYCHRFLYRE